MAIDYDMFLVVEGVHVAGLAIPHEESFLPLTVSQSVAFHSRISDGKAVEKAIMIADTTEVAPLDPHSTRCITWEAVRWVPSSRP